MKKIVKLAATVGVFLAASQASAALLGSAVALQPISSTATSNYGDPYTTARTIDQSDLSGSYVSGVTAASVIDGFTNLNQSNGWHGDYADTFGSITFDLGATYTLDRVYLFWMNGGAGNNIAQFSVQVSNDASFSTFVNAASFGNPTAAVDRIDFGSLATGEFVRLNWTGLQGQYPGLNEFVAGGVPASSSDVPEPSSIALLGLGLAGFTAARRKFGKQ